MRLDRHQCQRWGSWAPASGISDAFCLMWDPAQKEVVRFQRVE
jgi:hypothetical protein